MKSPMGQIHGLHSGDRLEQLGPIEASVDIYQRSAKRVM